MSSVQDYEKCPKCNGVMNVHFDCNTTEESGFCGRCGYTYSIDVILGEDKQPIVDQNNKWQFDFTETEGHGSYAIMQKNGFGQCGAFGEPIDVEIINEFKEIFAKPEINTEASYLVSFENGEVKLLLGTTTRELLDFDEMMAESHKELLKMQWINNNVALQAAEVSSINGELTDEELVERKAKLDKIAEKNKSIEQELLALGVLEEEFENQFMN